MLKAFKQGWGFWIVLAVGLAFFLPGLHAWWFTHRQWHSLQAKVKKAQRDLEHEKQWLQRLQKDSSALETLARRELDLVKPNEIEFRFETPSPDED